MDEIVIDANVFAHALNPMNDFFESALEIVSELPNSGLMLALDDTGKAAPSEWSSNLYREYTECMPSPSLSRDIIALLLRTQRVVFHARPRPEIWQRCRRLAPRNANDAVVLGIAVQANRHEIISNDYIDFHRGMRRDAKQGLGVTIHDSTEFST